LLRCPYCRGRLRLRDRQGDGEVDAGNLFCAGCRRDFLIKKGIARFISLEEIEGLNRRLVDFYKRFSRIEPILDRLSFIAMGGERKARTEILSRLELNGGRVLEVSVGSGGNLPYLFESPDVGEVFGLDISEPQLDRCRRLVASRGWPADLFLGMAEALPFEAESFDSVFHVGGINFFSDKGKAIEEMIRVARPGSKIIISDESERAARFIARVLRLRGSDQGRELDTSIPVDLVPKTMEEIRVDGIWKAHGHYHGYCLEFRKPA
jgi:SAM-dependent methyltransferase